jgi:hypothetical protein
MPDQNETIEAGLQASADLLLKLARKKVSARHDRVRLFARATREALDVLPLESRGPGFVLRTWNLPAFGNSLQAVFNEVSGSVAKFVSIPVARSVLFAYATRRALDDLSPDERQVALDEAVAIIGTPP